MTNLTFAQIIFKASHNSYDRNESIQQQLTFNPSTPYNCGCTGLELDIWRHSSNFTPGQSISDKYFTVAHTTPGNKKLSTYLSDILSWHRDNPNHDVVLITLDIKSTNGGYSDFNDAIDTYLKCYFGEDLIFKPHQLMRDSNLSLCENVIKHGWPTLSSSELNNKFIFCLSGNSDWKSEYAKTKLNLRYCFSDEDTSASDSNVHPPQSGNIVFFNFHVFNSDHNVWMNTIPPFADKNMITRTYVSDSPENWNNCIKANVSAIATNKVSNHRWAKVADDDRYAEKKSG
jgi:hypothetical protein